MCMIKDELFGILEYDYTWSGNYEIDFGKNIFNILLLVAGDESGLFEEGQYEAYRMFKKKWKDLQEIILSELLMYYVNRREELGYSDVVNEKYPEILSNEDLLNHITIVGIKIPYAEIYGGRSIGISFDCTWDDENGLGLRLNDENVIKVGFQDIAI